MSATETVPAVPETEEKHPPAVEGGVLKRLSVSQVQTFDPSQDGGCPRKWYFEKVMGIRPPSTKSQELGTEVHRQLEHYLKTGEDVLGPIARAGKHFLPVFNPQTVLSEVRFTDTLQAAGVPFVGAIDMINASGQTTDSEGGIIEMRDTEIEAVDFKTSSSPETWAKPGSALMRTVQMPGYGKFLSQLDPSIDRVRLSHITLATKGKPRAFKSTVLVPVEQIHQRWESVERVVREMKDVASATSIEQVPANFKACDAFRGCPHRAICPRPVEAALAAAFGGKSVKLLENLSMLTGAKPASAPPTPAPAPVAQPPAPVAAAPATGAGLLGKLAGLSAPATKPAPAVAAQAQVVAPPAPKAPAVEPLLKQVPAREARAGHHYLVLFSTGPVECRFVGRTKGGLFFEPLNKEGGLPVTLDLDTVIYALGTCDDDAVLPPDAPYSGESGPKAEALPPGVSLPEGVVPVEEPEEKVNVEDALSDEDGEIIPADWKPAVAAPVKDDGSRYMPKPQAEIAPKPQATSEEKPKRRGRGRPPGSKNKATLEREAREREAAQAPVAATPPAPAPVPAPAVTTTATTSVPVEVVTAAPVAAPAPVFEKAREPLTGKVLNDAPVAQAPATLTLYVDAFPVKGDAESLAGYAAGIDEAIRKTFGVGDMRCADDKSALAYGKWKGCVASAVRAAPPAPGTYFLFARGNEILEVVAATVAELADVVVQGR